MPRVPACGGQTAIGCLTSFQIRQLRVPTQILVGERIGPDTGQEKQLSNTRSGESVSGSLEPSDRHFALHPPKPSLMKTSDLTQGDSSIRPFDFCHLTHSGNSLSVPNDLKEN
jgi:hypothetical protein